MLYNFNFYYSTMNAGKSSHLLQMAHKYIHYGFDVICATASIDNRNDIGIISSRIGLSRNAYILPDQIDEVFDFGCKNQRATIFVDEVQFLDLKTVKKLYDASLIGARVFAYGLKNNYKGEIFSDAVSFLLANADKLVELECPCWCGNRAKQNFRYNEKYEQVLDGDVIDIGAEDKYISVCNHHFHLMPNRTSEYLQSHRRHA